MDNFYNKALLNSFAEVKFSKEGKKLADEYIANNMNMDAINKIKISKNKYHFYMYELVDIFKTQENMKKNIKELTIIGMALSEDMFEDEYNKNQFKKMEKMIKSK